MLILEIFEHFSLREAGKRQNAFKTGTTLTKLGILYGVNRNTIKNMLKPRMGDAEFSRYAKITHSSKLRKNIKGFC